MEDDTLKCIEFLIESKGKHTITSYCALLDAVTECANEASRTRLEHISGQDLAIKFGDLLLSAYGPMAIYVLDSWQIKNTRDIGEMVFDLVGVGLLFFSENDKIEDFDNVFDFHEKFVAPFDADEPYPDFQEIRHTRRI